MLLDDPMLYHSEKNDDRLKKKTRIAGDPQAAASEEFIRACNSIQSMNESISFKGETPSELTLYFLSIAKRFEKLPDYVQRRLRFDLEKVLYETEEAMMAYVSTTADNSVEEE